MRIAPGHPARSLCSGRALGAGGKGEVYRARGHEARARRGPEGLARSVRRGPGGPGSSARRRFWPRSIITRSRPPRVLAPLGAGG